MILSFSGARSPLSGTAWVVSGMPRQIDWHLLQKPPRTQNRLAVGPGLEQSSGSIVANGFFCAFALSIGAVSIAARITRRRACAKTIVRNINAATPMRSMCKETESLDSTRRRFEEVCTKAQDGICSTIEQLDGGAKFNKDTYTRDKGGGGVARVLSDGNMFEKAGINVSVVYGEMPPEALKAATERGVDRVGRKLEPDQKVPFFACGISSVMHPKNPFCPTMHFNYRYFETDMGPWWFGGGTDITPAYLDESDMKHFHGTCKNVCDKYDETWYPKFKDAADKYFVIGHRGETRGLGGIFFDDMSSKSQDIHTDFAADCLAAVTDAYAPILEKHRSDPFTPEQKQWQQLRRGRYVEFNLVYDRGTTFGLKMLSSGVGRPESILMSLPDTASWEYCHQPEPGSAEAEIMDCFKRPRNWV